MLPFWIHISYPALKSFCLSVIRTFFFFFLFRRGLAHWVLANVSESCGWATVSESSYLPQTGRLKDDVGRLKLCTGESAFKGLSGPAARNLLPRREWNDSRAQRTRKQVSYHFAISNLHLDWHKRQRLNQSPSIKIINLTSVPRRSSRGKPAIMALALPGRKSWSVSLE